MAEMRERHQMSWIEGAARDGQALPFAAYTSDQDGFTSASGNWTCCDANCSTMCTTVIPIPEYSDIISYQGVRIAIFVLYLIAIIAALLGNGCVLLVIYKKQSLRRNPTILFIFNLALCDFISCLLYRPLFLVELFLPFRKNTPEAYDHLVQCKITGYFQSVFAGVIIHTMVAISQERLLLIVRPLQAKTLCSSSRTKKILLLIWVTTSCVLLPSPILFTEMLVASIDGTVVSFCGFFSGGRGAIVYFSIIFAVYFVIPLVVMSFSYGKIFAALYRRSGRLSVTQTSGGEKSMRTRRSLARMMLSISIIFALCCGPQFIYLLYVTTGGTVPSNGFFAATIVKFLPIISSAVNPFVYTINSRTFRNGFKALFLRRKTFEDPSFGRSFTQSSSLRRKSSSRSWYSMKRQSSNVEGESEREKRSRASRVSSLNAYYRAVSLQRTSTLSTKIEEEPGVTEPLRGDRGQSVDSHRDSGLGPEESSGTNGGFQQLPANQKDDGTFGRSQSRPESKGDIRL